MADDRIDGLVERLDALTSAFEAHVASFVGEAPLPNPTAPSPDRAPAGPDAETFWALEGLKARTPEPGGVLFTGSVTLQDGRHLEWQEAFPLADLLEGFGEEAASSLAAIAHPVRLLILRVLLDGARTVAELGEHEGLATSGQTYHHLRQLVNAGWLRTVARGRYGVPPERVVPLLNAIAAVQR